MDQPVRPLVGLQHSEWSTALSWSVYSRQLCLGQVPCHEMGLGLYIARAIIEAHGGQIWAASAGPNQGATFTFTLPLQW